MSSRADDTASLAGAFRNRLPKIAIDLDNTIVCYDQLFACLALERELVPAEIPPRKTAVQEYLCARGREDVWTELQGEAYGPRMNQATMFAGADTFLRWCAAVGIETWIVSHRSRRPYSGRDYDLHAYAREWLAQRDLMPTARIFLETTRSAKLARIAELSPTHLIDDLTSIVGDPSLPPPLIRILFDPEAGSADSHKGKQTGARSSPFIVADWQQALRLLQSHVGVGSERV